MCVREREYLSFLLRVDVCVCVCEYIYHSCSVSISFLFVGISFLLPFELRLHHVAAVSCDNRKSELSNDVTKFVRCQVGVFFGIHILFAAHPGLVLELVK